AGGCYVVNVGDDGRYIARSGGDFTTTGDAGTAEPFHLQATDLGRYLLYGTAEDVVAGQGTSVVAAGTPTAAADWSVDDRGDAFALRLPSAGRVLVVDADGDLSLSTAAPAAVRFEAASGCAEFPEVEVNVTGPQLGGPNANGEVQGFVDTHLHVTA